MTNAYPAIGDCAVTAAAMRAAAAIIEEAALPGLSVTCTSREISGQVTAVPDGKLPHGWRWVTELDDQPGTTAGQQAVA
jgi:hypothetical protein